MPNKAENHLAFEWIISIISKFTKAFQLLYHHNKKEECYNTKITTNTHVFDLMMKFTCNR